MLILSPTAPIPQSWPDTFRARVELLAMIETLDANILASPSATAALEAWCAGLAVGGPATVKARLVDAPEKPVTDAQRARLRVDRAEPVKHRYVALCCGHSVLSIADNWYVPARLTPAMNTLLDISDAPFGKVVAPIEPSRQTIAAARLWSPLPPGWDRRVPIADGKGMIDIPQFLLEHRAVLYTAERLPFSEVHERYTRDILAFGPREAIAATAR